MNDYVFSKLKYQTITIYETAETQKKHGFFDFFSGGNTKNSWITVSDVQISNDNKATVKGVAHTFNSDAIEVKLNFIIEVQYDSDFTSYKILSENYDMPELIRQSMM